MYTFVCEKCGGTFESKSDPSKWQRRLCNNCRGNQYATKPVTSYQPKAVPISKPSGVVYTQPQPVVKKEFNLEEYIVDMLLVYATLKRMIDEGQYLVPEDNICQWTTSIMIQKEKFDRR